MRIREATMADGMAIVKMTERFLRDSIYGQFFTFNADAVADLMATVLQLGVVLLAVDDAGRVLGMIALAAIPHPISGETFVEEIAWWVEPEHRGGKVGPALLRKMEYWAAERGLHMAKLGAPADKPEVGLFYERLGYTAVEIIYAKRF